MRKLTPHEIQKTRLLKAARSFIRLKHSLRADQEIYERLPELSDRIDDALLAGRAHELDIRTLIDEEDG